MSVMTRGIISQPFTLAMHNDYTRRQFYSHAQVLLTENDRLSEAVESLIQMERATGNRAIEYAGKCDQLKAENEALRKDAERLQVSTALVQKLCDAAGNQPSVATGYLHDILAAMGKGSQS